MLACREEKPRSLGWGEAVLPWRWVPAWGGVPGSGRGTARPLVGAGFAPYAAGFQGAGWKNTPVLGGASVWEGRAAPQVLPVAAARSALLGSGAAPWARPGWAARGQRAEEGALAGPTGDPGLGAGESLPTSPVSLPLIPPSEPRSFSGVGNAVQDPGCVMSSFAVEVGSRLRSLPAVGLNPRCGLEAV